MVTIIIFLGITAVLGTAAYWGLRRVLVEQWSQWRQDRMAVQKAQAKEQRKQALRLEAMNSVLSQISDPADLDQMQTRRAA